MAETYCGKSCAECTRKEELSCPGCKMGAGKRYGGSCELAKCVRDKGHETCESCIFPGNCATLRNRELMPDILNRKTEAQRRIEEEIAGRAPVLGKWLWVLFWLFIPNTLGSLMGSNGLMQTAPVIYWIGQSIVLCGGIGYGLILLKLSSVQERYKTAAICIMIGNTVNWIVSLFTESGATQYWSLVFLIPAAILSTVGQYQEFMGHSAVLIGVDNDLSDKWELLWKWNIGLILGLLVFLLLMLILPLLGVLAMLAVVIGILIVSVLRMVYLYRTAKIFRDYPGVPS